jgi:hypothetical protein
MFYKNDHVIKAHTLSSDKITESVVKYNAHYAVICQDDTNGESCVEGTSVLLGYYAASNGQSNPDVS